MFDVKCNVSSFMFRVTSYELQVTKIGVSIIMYLVSCIMRLASCVLHLVSCILKPTQQLQHLRLQFLYGRFLNHACYEGLNK